MTILFSDVRGFTSISEALKPEELREYINAYLTDMSGIIRSRHRGTLDKYIGDAIMAFWGAPVDDRAARRNGVLAALEMQKEREILNEKFAARGWPTLKIGVGVNTGNMRVGDMGSQLRRAYTVMGDAVNLASRLEGLTKDYGVGILVGEATRKQVQDVVFRELDRVRVKGKDEAVTIYEPLGLEAEVDRKALDELKLWNQALRAYRAQQWDQVEVGLLNLQRMNPECGLYQVYVEKVAAEASQPAAGGLGRRVGVRREVGRANEAQGPGLLRRHRRAAHAHDVVPGRRRRADRRRHRRGRPDAGRARARRPHLRHPFASRPRVLDRRSSSTPLAACAPSRSWCTRCPRPSPS